MSSLLTTSIPNNSTKKILNKLLQSQDLEREEMRFILKKIMLGEISNVQVTAILIALRLKGESVDELIGATQVMRDLVDSVNLNDEDIIDLCGTGGDGGNTFNISTSAMFVAASAGAKIAKHGGRGVSSVTGSADLLEALGANINLKSSDVIKSIDEIGVGFMFAPNHHPSMKNVAPIRKELGTRTIFNVLGPLTNPARAKKQLIGVFNKNLLEPIVNVLKELNSKHVLVVHAENGLDEISLSGKTFYAELNSGKITQGVLTAEKFGLSNNQYEFSMDSIKVKNIEQSKKMIMQSLTDTKSYAAKIVALNAGAAIYIAGIVENLSDGFSMALSEIESGRAKKNLDNFIEFTNSI